MKISLDWLNAYLDHPSTVEEVERLLTDQGMPIETVEAVAGGDQMLDVEVTSNRSDCLSHVGVAREVAAGSDRRLKLPDVTVSDGTGEDIASLTSVENQAPELCPLYTARVIRGVKVAPSPDWLVRRLTAIGLRSVNNVVDVTNFVLMELGQPLHAFDLNLLAGRRIVVRSARAGEPFVAIDGSKHTLAPGMCVIADVEKPVAIAGVMGGLQSEVVSQTTDILLESAMFDPLAVRRTSRALRLASDSSYRFERGVDPRGVEAASARAVRLILELAGGTLAPGVIRVGIEPAAPRQVALRIARCNQLLGLELAPQRMVELLTALGLEPQLDDSRQQVQCRVPTHRLDLEREVDLIEEVARLQGFEHVPVHRAISIEARAVQPVVQARRMLGQTLVAHGYHETVNFSFIAPKLGEPFVPPGEQAVLIDDERRKAEPMLRPALAPSLLACRKLNQDAGNTDVRLFEAAAVWSRKGEETIERRRLGLLIDSTDDQATLRALRGTLNDLLERLGGDQATLEIAPVQHAPLIGAAELRLDSKPLGWLGVASPALRQLFGLQQSVAMAELDAEALLALYPASRVVRELPRFPAIERDLSVIVSEDVPWSRLESQVRQAQPELLEDLRFLVTYRGKPIERGRKSVSFRMLFRDPQGTLRHEHADAQVDKILGRLKDTLGAELRA